MAHTGGTNCSWPSSISPEQYSPAAFKRHIAATCGSSGVSGSSGMQGADPHWLTQQLDPSTLVAAVGDGQLPLQACTLLLQQGIVPPAVLPVERLVNIAAGWLEVVVQQQQLQQQQGGGTWPEHPAVQWVVANWHNLTAEQVGKYKHAATIRTAKNNSRPVCLVRSSCAVAAGAEAGIDCCW